MAIDTTISHYSTGTATVAANGTTVSGQGTAWTGALRSGDLFGTHRGQPIRILAVNSNTSLTLAHPWPGPAQTAAPYEIQCTPRDIGYRRAIEELIAGVSEGNLPLLADLPAAADKLAYFNSTYSMALADLTALGRSLLASASPAALWSAAGLSDGYVSIGGAQSITGRKTFTDATFISSNTPVLDFIAATVGGDGDRIRIGTVGAEFRVSARTPVGGFVRNLLELPWDGSGMNLGGSRVYARNNILGAVSRSGSVPTGAIIERGQNANGEYIRFADGTLICTSTVSTDLTSTGSDIFLFSSSFISAPAGAISWAATNADTSARLGVLLETRNGDWVLRKTVAGTGQRFAILTAIGRWF